MQSFRKMTSFSYSREFCWVATAHILIALLFIVNIPKIPFKKIPPISIEMGAAPPPSSGIQGPVGQRSNVENKVVKPTQKQDKDGMIKDVPSVQPQMPGGASSVGPAAARTTDSNLSFKVLKNIKPAYPPLAYRMRVEGTVTLSVEVLANGRVGGVSVAKSSGSDILDKSALDAVKLWEFSVSGGGDKSHFIQVPITFALKNR